MLGRSGTLMTHLKDDISILLILGGGGSFTTLAMCRVKYGVDWFEPWLILTKCFSALALAVIAFGEHRVVYTWWAAAPFLVSSSVTSLGAWLITGYILRRKSQDEFLDLGLSGSETGAANRQTSSRWMFYWGGATLVLLLASFIVAGTHGAKPT